MNRLFVLLAATLALITLTPLAALLLGASPSDVMSAAADADVIRALATSLGCALIATGIALVLGVAAGYVLARKLVRGRGVIEALLDLPVVLPHPIIGLGLLLVLARGRLVGAALEDRFGVAVASAAPGIVVCMLVVSAPFVVKAALEGFRAVPMSTVNVAATLGAPPSRRFWTIELPLAWPQIRAGAILAWARAVSEFGSVVVFAYYPRTAPVLIWDRFSSYGLRAALGPASLLMITCLVVFVALRWLSRGETRVQELER